MQMYVCIYSFSGKSKLWKQDQQGREKKSCKTQYYIHALYQSAPASTQTFRVIRVLNRFFFRKRWWCYSLVCFCVYDDTMSYYITCSFISAQISTQLHLLSSSSLHKLPNEKSLTTQEHIFVIMFTNTNFIMTIITTCLITSIFEVDHHDVICKRN